MAGRALKIEPQTTETDQPDARPGQTVDEASVATRAYELWQERGRPIGSDQEDWFKAENELKTRTTRGPKAA